ncbi:MAG: ABC transporter ATP-binding protein [Actinobacteria bacterium]|nr:ABC transporter ATP-binding protein [Actinomycetota bacterium]
MLDVRALVKHYPTAGGEPVRAVDGVSFEVRAGELVAIYGPSGSGKSTLLMLVAAVMRPDSGEILVGGHEISRLGDRDAARYRLHEVGFVSQTFHLISGLSAIDNAIVKLVGSGMRPKHAQQRITPLLARLGVDSQAERAPSELSMGEQQRIAIAKALSTNPSLLLADEPTGNLDTRRSRAVLALLSEVCREQGTAGVLVTHDPEALGYVDRAYTLRDGRLGEHRPDDTHLPLLPTLEQT